MKTYFEKPTQVMFFDEEGTRQFGIAYEDYIICGCCGGVFYIDDVIADAPEECKQAIYEYDTWSNLADEIYGGYLPETYEEE